GLRQPGAPRAAAAVVAARWSAVVDEALAALGVPARRRSAGLTAVVAGAIVGIALTALLDDEPVRPAGAITTLAPIIHAERRPCRPAPRRVRGRWGPRPGPATPGRHRWPPSRR